MEEMNGQLLLGLALDSATVSQAALSTGDRSAPAAGRMGGWMDRGLDG